MQQGRKKYQNQCFCVSTVGILIFTTDLVEYNLLWNEISLIEELKMSLGPTVISYRSQLELASRFLNIEDLLKNDDSEKIKKVYEDIFKSVTAYETNHAESLLKVEGRIYDRIIALKTVNRLEITNRIQKNTTGWKAIVLQVFTLGIGLLYLVIKKGHVEKQIGKMNQAHAKFSRSLSQMQQRVLAKELHPKLFCLQALEKKRCPNLDEELNRLKSNPRIAKSLENVTRRVRLSISHQVAFARSLELQEALQDTHYVINHGQNLELMVVNMIIRMLKKEFEPLYYESFEQMRHDTALRHIKEDAQTTAWFKNTISQGKMNDHDLRRELISGDCVLESTSKNESALDFFSGKENIAFRGSLGYIYSLLMTITEDYITDHEVARKLCQDLSELIRRFPRGGNLYSICIPKKEFDKSCYFSQPYGVPHKDQGKLMEKIEEMQSGKDPCGYPQIRVLTHKIRAEDGYHVILNSTIPDSQLLKIEEEVSLCMQAALTAYRVPGPWIK